MTKSFDLENQVSTTEIAYGEFLTEHFAMRNAKLIAIIPDTLESIRKWQGTIEAAAQKLITMPIVADVKKSIAHSYNM